MQEQSRKHVAAFKEGLWLSEYFASRLSSALRVECLLGRQVSRMVPSAPLPADSAQASASVAGMNVVLGSVSVPVCASAGDSGVVQRQTPVAVAGANPAGASAVPLARP